MHTTIIAAMAALLLPTLAHAADASDCHIGAYRLAGGGAVTIDLSTDNSLRWHRLDGTTGAVHPGADGVWSSTLG
jgi:hypothetical protein